MGEVKGTHKRSLEVPGYRIKPKWDLPGLRRRQSHKGKNSEAGLSLTPMIDIFSILVIFLLMNFSTTGEIFFINKNIKLPPAKNTNPLESRPLLSIVGNNVVFEMENKVGLPTRIEESLDQLHQLKLSLEQLKNRHQKLHPNQSFKGDINIQADESANFGNVKKVLRVLTEKGWTAISFATRK